MSPTKRKVDIHQQRLVIARELHLKYSISIEKTMSNPIPPPPTRVVPGLKYPTCFQLPIKEGSVPPPTPLRRQKRTHDVLRTFCKVVAPRHLNKQFCKMMRKSHFSEDTMMTCGDHPNGCTLLSFIIFQLRGKKYNATFSFGNKGHTDSDVMTLKKKIDKVPGVQYDVYIECIQCNGEAQHNRLLNGMRIPTDPVSKC